MKKNLLVVLLLASLLFPLCTTSAHAEDWTILKQTTGVVLGVGLGPAVGGLRGLTKGWLWGTGATAEALGDKDGVAQQVVGFATGGVIGAAAGGVSGVLMGAYDGLRYGWDKPWSHENFSCAGKDFTDYDPFKWE